MAWMQPPIASGEGSAMNISGETQSLGINA
ncbi:hypothetical protein ABIG06_005469 [Bradyrhizobium sp. USDA 326]